jgi:hypothetical protein
MDQVKKVAMCFLSNRVLGPNDAVMFDIDDALIRVNSTPIREMISLYKFAEMVGYKMVIITARPYFENNAHWTATQLLEVGINPSNLYFTPAQLKGDGKKELGYNFVLSVGDQWTDLTDSEKWIKLPDHNDTRILTNFS